MSKTATAAQSELVIRCWPSAELVWSGWSERLRSLITGKSARLESAHEFAILDVMTNEDALPEEDTIPSCRFGRDRQGMPNFFDRMQEDEPQRVSGTHPLGAPGPDISAERRAQREPNNEAHDEMLRAVARGECVIFADALTRENLRVQHSAWLLPDQGAVFATWLFDGGRWRETQSYLVASGAMAALSELLSRGARG